MVSRTDRQADGQRFQIFSLFSAVLPYNNRTDKKLVLVSCDW